MTQMIRKQIYIGKRQEALLKRLAKARQVSEAEIVRQALEHEALVTRAPAFQSDPQAWADVLRLITRRRALGVTGEPYRFNREEIYEEREARWLKPRAAGQ